ncbi:disintegrin and metalloproteinase domain-containing protein 28-like [Colossoma macropomum]|uniref:disintegrin and metalloproteinase domain-containing protein 28-like n=1 Tax=Colossoma macropomum TaxID=42526 RepID=UPI0018652CED|nr:disintegrin and metalloproteinase domain-containing protein 28-like [Colossoma macropomum]
MCGKLFCSNGTAAPLFGTGVTLGSCKVTIYSDPTMDYGQVKTGTKCGDGQVCSNSACVELDVAYGEINCSITCKGNAVCNNKAECQCIPGWVPPDCTNRYTDHIIYTNNAEPGLSREAYTAMAACLAVILTVLVVAVTVAAVWRIKMRKQEQSRQSLPEAGGNTNQSKSDIKQTPKVFIIP